MSLQERTLVVRNFDPEKTTAHLLKELCIQSGPVKNVVIKPDHAFVEFEDVDSVGYCKALLDGVVMFGQKLSMEPRLKTPCYFKYTKLLNDYINYDKQRQHQTFEHHRAVAEREYQEELMKKQYQSPQQRMPQPSQGPSSPSPFVDPFPQQYPINFVQSADPQIFEPNPFMQTQFATQSTMQAPPWQQQMMPTQFQMVPQQMQFYPAPSGPTFSNYRNDYNLPPPPNQFRPYLPRDLANRPFSDKDRWNRRR